MSNYDLFSKTDLAKIAAMAGAVKTADGKSAIDGTLAQTHLQSVSDAVKEAVTKTSKTVTTNEFYALAEKDPAGAAKSITDKFDELYQSAGNAAVEITRNIALGVEKVAGERDTAQAEASALKSANAALVLENGRLSTELGVLRPNYERAKTELDAYHARDAKLQQFMDALRAYTPKKIDINARLA